MEDPVNSLEDPVNSLTLQEKNAIASLRALDPIVCQSFDDDFLSYFVLARKLDVQRSLEVLKNHIVWRKEFDMDNLDLVRIKRVLLSGM
jgi:hypothetical protein